MKKSEKKTLEECFAELDVITKEMNSGDLSLQEMFEKYKQGVALVKECGKILDTVEKELVTLRDETSEKADD